MQAWCLGWIVVLATISFHIYIEVGHGSDNRWTLCIPLRSDVVVGVVKVASDLLYKTGTT
jgi:hypothetical protein